MDPNNINLHRQPSHTLSPSQRSLNGYSNAQDGAAQQPAAAVIHSHQQRIRLVDDLSYAIHDQIMNAEHSMENSRFLMNHD